MKLYNDNKVTVSISPKIVLHFPSKHVKIDRHFKKGNAYISLVPTSSKLNTFLWEVFLEQIFISISKLDLDTYVPAESCMHFYFNLNFKKGF